MKEKIGKFFLQGKILRSLKFRIFLIIVLVGLIPSMILRFGILQNYEERAVNLKTLEVQNQYKILANHLTAYNYLNNTSSEIVNAELDQLSTLYDGRVLIVDSNFQVIRDTYGLSEGKTIISKEVMQCFNGTATASYDRENQYIELTTPITEASQGTEMDTEGDGKEVEVVGVILAGVATDTVGTSVGILAHKASIIQFLMSIILIAIAWSLSIVTVKPFDKVTDAIAAVKDGFNTERISVRDYWETEHILEAFNELLGRMKLLDESRQEFVSNVSHELKTPLTSMKVLADSLIAQEEVPNELYKEFMTDIADEIERENKIINDLLSLVKMDKTAADLNIETVDINELMELILRRLRPIAKGRDIEVIYESARAVSAEIDEVKFTLAISNLVENAIKYNLDHGFVKVKLDADHQYFTVVVSDNGIGIPKEAQEHIFERFYRVDKSHSREIGGTGLGLAIVKKVVDRMGGTIKVSSIVDKGTYITLCFIVEPVAVVRSAADPRSADRKADNLSGQVLVAEDNEINQEIAARILEALGLMVTVVPDGRACVDQVTAEPDRYQLIFMDIQMPVMDGYEATEAIRASTIPAVRSIPIVAMTADAFSAARERCMAVGMDDMVTKPIDPAALSIVIKKYLDC